MASGEHGLAVGEDEEARLLAGEVVLDDDLVARRRRGAGEAGVDRGDRLVDRHRDGDALAGGEPVGLDHDRRAAIRR